MLKTLPVAEKREENPEILTNLRRKRLTRFFGGHVGVVKPETHLIVTFESLEFSQCVEGSPQNP